MANNSGKYKNLPYADARRAINKDELKRYLAERGSVQYLFDLLEKVEDGNEILEPIELQRLKLSIDTRLALLKKYLPDEKHVEVANPEGEEFIIKSIPFEIVDASD